ncbi:MAG TPA: spore coat associated protein CotJA [Clostridiales bacterium]|nr:spore coat associated protein CotJA [Clostridiales bacterium]
MVLPFPPNSKLARAFFVAQRYTTSFPPREALERGTMFPELFTPWPSHH